MITAGTRPPKGQGGGYRKAPHHEKPIAPGAVWATAVQVQQRYGNRSHMWLVHRLQVDPHFPRPRYKGRMRLWSVKELNEYDARLIAQATSGGGS
jgi:hypothetical protein